jgi:hypothetical protein
MEAISVLMAYCDRLQRFTHWYVQLWAESLGKNGKGTTPLAALGPVDQHSQLQLFISGRATSSSPSSRPMAPGRSIDGWRLSQKRPASPALLGKAWVIW